MQSSGSDDERSRCTTALAVRSRGSCRRAWSRMCRALRSARYGVHSACGARSYTECSIGGGRTTRHVLPEKRHAGAAQPHNRANGMARGRGGARTANIFPGDTSPEFRLDWNDDGAPRVPEHPRSHLGDCCGDERCLLLEAIRRQLTAAVHPVPLAPLTHDPLVVAQSQPVQHVLGTLPVFVGHGVGDA